MIDIHGLAVRFPGTTVLEVDALTVPDGALTYLLGLNGTGKTTLMRCICGILAPAAGTVEVDGRPVRAYRDTPASLGMHLSYQAFEPRHTARRHLRWIARARGLPREKVGEVLDTVQLSGKADRRLGTYSLGMLQRVGIAAALLSAPRTLVLDEPFNGLDIAGILWMRDLLRGLVDAGTCVLVATHTLDEVERTADRVIVLGGGRVLADDTSTGLMAGRRSGDTGLEDIYLRIAGMPGERAASGVGS